MLRAAGWGAVVAVVLLAVAAALVLTGVVDIDPQPKVPERLLVIATAPDDEGTEVAAVAFVIEAAAEAPVILDVDATVTVPGTSASSARNAFPFGGGDAVASALDYQTGERLDWIVVPWPRWSELVDAQSGIQVEVPERVTAYRDGRLIVVEEGTQRLEAAEVVALATAAPFVSEGSREVLSRSLGSALSAVVLAESAGLADAVDDGRVDSSLPASSIEAFLGSR